MRMLTDDFDPVSARGQADGRPERAEAAGTADTPGALARSTVRIPLVNRQCQAVEALLESRAGDRATPEERVRAASHLSVCGPCRRKLARLKALDRLNQEAAGRRAKTRMGRYAPFLVAGSLALAAALALGLRLASFLSGRHAAAKRVSGSAHFRTPEPAEPQAASPVAPPPGVSSLELASRAEGSLSFDRLMAFFGARRDDETAAGFARDFMADPELAGHWNAYADGKDGAKLVAGLRASRKFGKLLEKYAGKPGFKELAEKTAAHFDLRPEGRVGGAAAGLPGSVRAAGVPARQPAFRRAIRTRSTGPRVPDSEARARPAPSALSALAASGLGGGAPAAMAGGGENLPSPAQPQAQAPRAKEAGGSGRKPADLARLNPVGGGVPVPETRSPHGDPSPMEPTAAGPSALGYWPVTVVWTGPDGGLVAREIRRKLGNCGAGGSAACAERDEAAYAGLMEQARRRMAADGVDFDEAAPEQKRKAETYAFCKSRLWQYAPEELGCRGYP